MVTSSQLAVWHPILLGESSRHTDQFTCIFSLALGYFSSIELLERAVLLQSARGVYSGIHRCGGGGGKEMVEPNCNIKL